MGKHEFTITRETILHLKKGNLYVETFDELAPNGECALSELLNKCEKNGLSSFASFLIEWFPRNPELRVIEEYDGGDIFYNGDVHIKKCSKSSGNIICKRLNVDGVLVVGENRYVLADVDAEKIELMNLCSFKGNAYTYSLISHAFASLTGSIQIKH